jgi:hypothetical protein
MMYEKDTLLNYFEDSRFKCHPLKISTCIFYRWMVDWFTLDCVPQAGHTHCPPASASRTESFKDSDVGYHAPSH